MKTRTFLALALFGTALAGCSGSGYGYGGGPTDPPPNDHTIVGAASERFTPGTITVRAGDVVTFDFRSLAHNVFFEAQTGAPADIGGENANVTVTRTFTTAGTYRFTCHIHPSMRGSVVVQ